MARLPRLAVAGHLHLLIQRGHGGQPVFRDADDFASYLGCLQESAAAHAVAVHAFALLDAEVLLLATPQQADGLSRMMQAIGRRFVPAYNRRHGRGGALWERRFSSTVVEVETHGVACLRLVEQAPVQAGITASATDYPGPARCTTAASRCCRGFATTRSSGSWAIRRSTAKRGGDSCWNNRWRHRKGTCLSTPLGVAGLWAATHSRQRRQRERRDGSSNGPPVDR